MTPIILVALAGLMGAVGVVLLAAAAHAAPGAGLESAGQMLLFHAAAVVAATTAFYQGLLWRPLGIAAAIGFVAGAALFSGDIAMRAFAGHRLFPFAAPSGGFILIASWLALAVAAVLVLARAN
ncbi:MAG TPA: DUF423 domain-containing protein [Xanthobacteraceae bacterium]|nr:DUF423 domain-containing protein [Xanthobacteraceae bacterium]